MNSKLFTNKTAFAFAGVIVVLLTVYVLVNIYLIRPAVASREYVTHIEAPEQSFELDPLASKTDDGFIYYLFTSEEGDKYIRITSYMGENPNVVIPREIEGYPVTVIDETCFSYNDKIESVEIPISVTYIDGWAFASCRNLKEVHIPDSVTEIGPYITLDSKKAVVYGAENSCAQQYCKENGIPFKAEV